jgi:hypothetical protein
MASAAERPRARAPSIWREVTNRTAAVATQARTERRAMKVRRARTVMPEASVYRMSRTAPGLTRSRASGWRNSR